MKNSKKDWWQLWGSSVAFCVAFIYMLGASACYGFSDRTTQMGWAVAAGALGMAFCRLREIVEVSALGIRVKTRELDKTLAGAKSTAEELLELQSLLVVSIVRSQVSGESRFIVPTGQPKDGACALAALRCYAACPVEGIEEEVLELIEGVMYPVDCTGPGEAAAKRSTMAKFVEKREDIGEILGIMKQNEVREDIVVAFEQFARRVAETKAPIEE